MTKKTAFSLTFCRNICVCQINVVPLHPNSFAIRESRTINDKYMINNGMKQQDVLVLLKKTTSQGAVLSNNQLAAALGISASAVCESLQRSCVAQLVDEKKKRVNVLALLEFLQHGIRYVFPAIPGRVMRGVATFVSASPMKEQVVSGNEKFVWPYVKGSDRGQKIAPLYATVPQSALQDIELYQLLVLVDTLRLGRVREREIAITELTNRLRNYGEN